MQLIESLKTKVRNQKPTIVFPEGSDSRVLKAAIRLHEDKDIKPIVLGNKQEIKKLADKEKVDLKDLEIIDPEGYEEFDAMVDAFVKRRAGKATVEDAKKVLDSQTILALCMFIWIRQMEWSLVQSILLEKQ